MTEVKHQPSQYLAEFIGTFFLVFFGCGAVILSEVGPSAMGPFVPFIFGGIVAAMIYAVGHISGAHFNPAVTLSFWAMGRFPKRRVAGYVAAQVLGATLASSVHGQVWAVEHSFGVTGLSVEWTAGFGLELLLSFALMFVIASVATDSRATGEMAGMAIGLIVTLCAFVGGPLTGASMNPARSMGPALLAGQLSELWLYCLAPIFGAVLGAKTYEWIRCHKPESEDRHGCC